MMRKKLFCLIFMILLFIIYPSFATGKVKVVTSTQDLASITKAIVGSNVEVVSIGKGNQNPHFIPPKPSYMLKLKDAHLLVVIGMDMETWMDSLIEGSRNQRIYKNGAGYVNASINVPVLGVQGQKLDRSFGDVHPYGNPHYWLDPVNARYMSENIVKGLKRVDPANSDYYEQNRQKFLQNLATRLTGWLNKAQALKGEKVITYHESWPYFMKRFGLEVVGTIEPKPGIPPTAKHMHDLIRKVKENHVKFIIMEPYFNRSVPDQIAIATGAKVVIVPPSVGGDPYATDYLNLFDRILNLLLEGLGESKTI